jgi:hypothetical protein
LRATGLLVLVVACRPTSTTPKSSAATEEPQSSAAERVVRQGSRGAAGEAGMKMTLIRKRPLSLPTDEGERSICSGRLLRYEVVARRPEVRDRVQVVQARRVEKSG